MEDHSFQINTDFLRGIDPWMAGPTSLIGEDINIQDGQGVSPRNDIEVSPSDSASQNSHKSNTSSVRNALMESTANKAALQAKLECLKRKQALDREAQELSRRMEQLKVEEELAAATARVSVIQGFQEEGKDNGKDEDIRRKTQVKETYEWKEIQNRQSELTEKLLECHMKSSLPKRSLQPFDGNPLHYHAFTKAFMHVIESKTTDFTDRLYFLEQYTRGPANEIVRSCMYGADPEQAYKKAKEQLGRKFGNKYLIFDAMITKASTWPIIKSEAPQELQSYAMFLTELNNLSKDLGLHQEINHSQNLRMAISKLPFKLKDKWRNLVDSIQESQDRTISFDDVVRFVDRQARVINDPVFGNIAGTTSNQSKGRATNSRTTFNTKVSSSQKEEGKGQCLYCTRDNHNITECRVLERKPHDEKIKFCMEKGLCFACLQASHMSKDCEQRLVCKVCQRRHPTVLHRKYFASHKEEKKPDRRGNEDANTDPNCDRHENENTSQQTASGESDRVKCTLTNEGGPQDSQPAIIPVLVRCRETKKEVQTYALIDSGSNATFCTSALQDSLNVKGKRRQVQLQTMTDERTVKTVLINGLEVTDLSGKSCIPLPGVYVQPSIPVARDEITRQHDLERWSYLHDVQIQEIDADVGLLIGNNVPKALEPLEVVNSQEDGPFACRSMLGWMVYGCATNERYTSRIDSFRVCMKEDIQQQLDKLYNTDFSERLTDDREERSLEDKAFMREVEGSTKLCEGHFQIRLPFKGDDVSMPNNRVLAEQRLAHLKRKFQKQPDFYQKYKECMEANMNKGYIEEIQERDLQGTEGRIWYLPHHGVKHPQKEKLRVVYDCSAKYRDTSLNEVLLKGPDLTNALCGVLTRFRRERVAVMADIEGMFSQVKVPDSDRDFLRLLWWEEGDIQKPIKEHRMTVHVFGAISSPSCANFALRKTAQEQTEDFSGEVIEALRRNFYVDDCLCSAATVTQAIKLTQDLTLVCKNRGFHLTKWTSNGREVLENIPPEERAKTVRDLNFQEGPQPAERALGMLWNTDDDSFGFKIELKEKPPTRRGILSVVSSLFDPLGLVSPVVLPAKQLLQTLCQIGLGWDEPIPPELMRKWQMWKIDLPGLSAFRMPRCLKPEGFETLKSIQIHHFSDASEKGYGTVSYLRMVNQRDDVECTLLMSKARVAPLKQISIPRMELTAAVVAVKVDKMIKREIDLPIQETFYWTDSTSVLRYIQNRTTRFKTFVANRIAIIQDGSLVHQWNYVETSQNPADVCSRGAKVEQFLNSKFWKEGPEFLQLEQDEWPQQPKDLSSSHQDDPEVKKKTFAINASVGDEARNQNDEEREEVHALAGTPDDDKDPISRLIQHYSDWNHLLKAVAWLLRLKDLLKLRKKANAENPTKLLTITDMKRAEEAILSYTQQKAFAEEIKVLKKQNENQQQSEKGKAQIKKCSPIYKLDPWLDKGLLRVGGRLRRAPLPIEVKNPVIVPKGSHIAELILRNIHEKAGHFGRNFVMAEFQQKYYMTGVNSAIKKMVRKCVQCRKQRESTMEQRMADLPKDRLVPNEPPFTRVGMDYFGPIEVKRGRSMVKRYGVLFTCMTTRAIHIEKADSLDTDSCIAAIRRFVARRGAVKEMRSDNGTNLVGAEKELRKELEGWNQAQVNDAMLQKGIKWTFNPPAGSHHGGIWERQIRTVRQILFSLTQQQSLSDETLATLFCEVEAIVNSRPITKVSDDINDLEALTPNHLLLMKSTPLLPPSVTRKTDVYSRRWKQVQYMADVFWRRWLREYLPQLQERQKWVCPRRNLQVGDVVLVVDDTAPRNSWMLGRVQRTMPDKEGFVRRAEVKTKTGSYLRPISKLCLILEGDS